MIRQNYRIYPNKQQIQVLNQELGNQRFVWNYFLDLNIERYKSENKFMFYNEMSSTTTKLKTEFDFLKLGDSQSLQQTLRNLDKALKQSFSKAKNRKGFPKFKRKSNSETFSRVQRCSIIDNKLKLPKIGLIKIKDNGLGLPENFNSLTVKKTASNKWFVSFVVPYEVKKQVVLDENSKFVGIDLNSRHFVVLSDGKAVVNPKHLLQKEKQLKRYQRRYSRKKNQSSNKNKARIKLARIHESVANSRKDFIEKLTTQIAKTYDYIAIEDLNVKAMQKWNGRMIQSAPFGMFRTKLVWKANKLGKHLITIGRFDPTSKICSSCGQIHELNLSQRRLNCDCGLEIHRDHNAAINILNVSKNYNTVGITEIYVSGDASIPDSNISWVSLNEKVR